MTFSMPWNILIFATLLMTLLHTVAAVETISDVEHDCLLLVEWFRDNYMTLNASKCYLLVSGHKDDLNVRMH